MKSIFLRSKKILTKNDSKKLLLLSFSKLFLGLAEIVSVLSFIPFLSIISNPNYINESNKIIFVKEKYSLSDDLIAIGLAVIPFIIIIFVNILRLSLVWFEGKVINDLWYSVHSKLFDFYLRKNYMFHVENGSNVLMEKLMVRANTALNSVIIPIYQIIGNILLSSLVVGALIFYNPVMAILTFVMIVIFYLGLYSSFAKKIDSYGRFAPKFSQTIFKLVEETFKSIKTVKLRDNSKLFVDQFKKNARRYTSNSTYLDFFITTPKSVTEIFGYSFALAATLILLFYQKQTFSDIVVILGIYLVALQKLMPVVQDLFIKFSGIKVNRFSLDIIEEDLKASSNIDLNNSELLEVKKINNFDQISIENLRFNYNENQSFQLSVNNFKINSNDLIGISGKSGSGKSTFLNILTGLIHNEKISINLDQNKIKENEIFSYQNLIDYLPQNIFILNDTINRNIAFGVSDEKIDKEKVKLSAKLACIDDYIETKMPEKYESIVGEDAAKLSGGQRQRIGLARALYANKKILIMDEATSSLDKKNEDRIIQNIMSLKDKTVIIVTHNLEVLNKMKRKIIFEEGKLIEKN